MAQRSHRLYVDAIERAIHLDRDRAHYLRDVLRLRPGDELVIFDGRIEAEARVVTLDRKAAALAAGAVLRRAVPRPRLHLAQAALKTNLEPVAQAATELAITDFWVFAASRSNAPARLRRDRLQRVVQSAAEQCRRVSVPRLHEADDTAAMASALADTVVFFADTATAAHSGDFARSMGDTDTAILIGPEGGWTDAERAHLVNQGAHPLHLGALVLRATTAGHAALAALHSTRGWPRDAEPLDDQPTDG